jgi:hypothetical protein
MSDIIPAVEHGKFIYRPGALESSGEEDLNALKDFEEIEVTENSPEWGPIELEDNVSLDLEMQVRFWLLVTLAAFSLLLGNSGFRCQSLRNCSSCRTHFWT